MTHAWTYSAGEREDLVPVSGVRFDGDWVSAVSPFSSPIWPSRVIADFSDLSFQRSRPAFSINEPRNSAALRSRSTCLSLSSASFSRWAVRSAIGFFARGIRNSFMTLRGHHKGAVGPCSGLQNAPFKVFCKGEHKSRYPEDSKKPRNRARSEVKVVVVPLCHITHDALPAKWRIIALNQDFIPKSNFGPQMWVVDTGRLFLQTCLGFISIHPGYSPRRLCNKWQNGWFPAEATGPASGGRDCA